MITLLTDRGTFRPAGARPEGAALWLPAPEAEAATGWVLRPEGFCQDDRCVPLPPGRAGALVRDDGIDVAGLWRHLGRAVAASDRGHVWVLGGGAGERAAALRSLQAPDFTLPDHTGRLHSLADHRGRKVLLVTWASW